MKTKIQNNVGKFAKKVYSAADKAIFRAVMQGGGLVKKEAASRGPTPKYGKALKVVGKNPKGGPEAHVGISRKSKHWYLKFFDSGTKRHKIKPKNGKFLSWITTAGGKVEFIGRTGRKVMAKYYVTKDGKYTFDKSEQGWTFAKSVNHPGMEKKPALKPAFQAKIPEIQEVIADTNEKLLVKAAREASIK